MMQQPACDGLDLLAQSGICELRVAYGKRKAARMSKRAFIKRMGKVVLHDCSLLNKKDTSGGCVQRKRGENTVLERATKNRKRNFSKSPRWRSERRGQGEGGMYAG